MTKEEITAKKFKMNDYAWHMNQSANLEEKMFCAKMISEIHNEIVIAESLIGEVF